jgi:hypothetical protein
MLNAQKRYGRTQKKMISLTDDGRAQIQAFAEAHNMTFSAAIESLALIGMKADLTALLVPLLRDIVAKTIERNFNRMAKLGLIAAAEAAMAHDISSMLMMQTIRQEAVRQPADFEERMLVSYDPQDKLDARIRALYREARQLAQERRQRLLKKPLQELVSRLATGGEEAVDE